MPLPALILAIAALLGRGTPSPEVVSAIAEGCEAEAAAHPVDASMCAALLTVWAARESCYNPRAVNATGRSFGLWQQGREYGTAAPVVQARHWLHLLRIASRHCPDSPAAMMWGACHARDVLTRRDVHDLAAERVALAERLLAQVATP